MSSDYRVSRKAITPPLKSWNLLQDSSGINEEDRKVWQTLTEFLRNTGHPREANHMVHCRVRLENEVLTIYTSDQYLTYFGNPQFEHAAEVCCGRRTQIQIEVDPVLEEYPDISEDVSAAIDQTPLEKPATWMTQPRPASSNRQYIYMLITPVLANTWLDAANIENRKLSNKWCAALANDMANSRWKDTGQTITFNRNGDIINGQHRLVACVRSKKAFLCDVIFGLPLDAFESTDIGRSRTMGDIATIKKVSNANLISAVANLLCVEERYGGLNYHGYNNCTKPEILETLLKHDNGLQRAAATCGEWYKRKLATPRVVVFSYYQFSQPAELPKLSKRLQQEGLTNVCKRFFDEVMNGMRLEKTSPAFHLHQRLITQAQSKAKYRAEYIIAQFRVTWCAYREDRPFKRLKLELDTKTFPKLD